MLQNGKIRKYRRFVYVGGFSWAGMYESYSGFLFLFFLLCNRAYLFFEHPDFMLLMLLCRADGKEKFMRLVQRAGITTVNPETGVFFSDRLPGVLMITGGQGSAKTWIMTAGDLQSGMRHPGRVQDMACPVRAVQHSAWGRCIRRVASCTHRQ